MSDQHFWRILRAASFAGAFFVLLALAINILVWAKSKEFILDKQVNITTIESMSVLGTPESVIAPSPTVDSVLAPTSRAEAAILLGASVLSNGELTAVLRDRADTAAELFKNGYVEKILVSGDGSSEYYNEVKPIRSYLLAQGVPDEDIVVDNAGLDTYDSMLRAKGVFGVRSALVVSQRFHLFRALFAARALGIDAYGVSADRRTYSDRNHLREFFATVKTFGETLPISRF